MKSEEKAVKLLDLMFRNYMKWPGPFAFDALNLAMLAYQAFGILPSPATPNWARRYDRAKRKLGMACKAAPMGLGLMYDPTEHGWIFEAEED